MTQQELEIANHVAVITRDRSFRKEGFLNTPFTRVGLMCGIWTIAQNVGTWCSFLMPYPIRGLKRNREKDRPTWEQAGLVNPITMKA